MSIELVLSPAWTTDWITEAGREALEKYGRDLTALARRGKIDPVIASFL